MSSKAELRKQIATQRGQLDPAWISYASKRIVQSLSTLPEFKAAQSVGLYLAIGGEVMIDALLPVCWEQGKHTCIPVFNAEMELYEMAEISDGTEFSVGHYGIREPVSPQPVGMDWPDLIVAPGVAFDTKGRRLGRGGGYYDRLLDGFKGAVVGVAFDFQVFPAVPTDAHDQSVDTIVTETKVVDCK